MVTANAVDDVCMPSQYWLLPHVCLPNLQHQENPAGSLKPTGGGGRTMAYPHHGGGNQPGDEGRGPDHKQVANMTSGPTSRPYGTALWGNSSNAVCPRSTRLTRGHTGTPLRPTQLARKSVPYVGP